MTEMNIETIAVVKRENTEVEADTRRTRESVTLDNKSYRIKITAKEGADLPLEYGDKLDIRLFNTQTTLDEHDDSKSE